MEHLRENHSKRNVYIDNHPRSSALEAYMALLAQEMKKEEVAVGDALDRVTAKAVFAEISSPHYHSSAMDGIAVKSESTYKANERHPVILTENVEFVYINTGYALPDDYDAVIMIEDVIPIGEETVKIMASAHPWQHIRMVGEDVAKGEMIVPSNHRLRAIDIGALFSAGITKLEVVKKMKVGIIPTGNEITRDIDHLKKGQIIDSNTYMFQGLVREAGGIANVYEPVNDQPELLKKVIQEVVDHNDLVIINAGSSAGSKDYTVDIIRELGQVMVHGIAMKPGKPTILGTIDGKGVIGIPGYPVSAYFSFMTFADPIIRSITSQKETNEDQVTAVLSKRVVSSLKHEEFIRVTIGHVNNRLIATPLNRGAGNTTSLVRADGILVVPREFEGLEAGKSVKVKLMKPLNKIKDRAVLIGSHDIILDLIGDRMPVSSAHVGSLGGIMAKLKNECLIAPIHLIDPETGQYNDKYVKQYFPNKKMSIIHGVKRLQGFMLNKGNPKSIKGFQDLTSDKCLFANRQKGSGTRQLLDYHLKAEGLDPQMIQGYKKELATHMAVAVAVSSGVADVGVGIYAAAKSMDLDFEPIAYESYEFLLATEDLEDDRVKAFLQVLRSQDFKSQVEGLGGYNLDEVGRIREVGGCLV